jgi:hypothetical protein
MKLIQIDLYKLYVDFDWHFSHDQFYIFVDLVGFKFNVLSTIQHPNPTT